MANNEYYFELHISGNEYLRYYKGQAQSIVVTALDGRNVKFPATALREFVDELGVHGRFVLETDANNKLLGVRRF